MSDSKQDLKFLEKITNGFGPSGHEREVQKIILEYGKPYADEVLFDKTGSMIFKVGTNGPKLMLAGHVDEIGYIICAIEKNGYLKISNLGGVFPLTLTGHQILIRPFSGGEKIIGITTRGSLAGEHSDKLPKLDELYVDIGCNSDEEVKELGIEVGDVGVPYVQYRDFFRIRKEKKKEHEEKDQENINASPEQKVHLAVAKSFDDRIGVFMILEVLRRLKEDSISHPNIVYAVSTVQEELGTRGAKTSAQLIQPDIGFSIDVTIDGSVPMAKDINQKMGNGAAIGVYDRTMIANPIFRKFVMDLAKEKGIKAQVGFLKVGGTDAGSIHLTGIGVPSLFIGIPTRYVHSHYAQLDLGDVEEGIKLLIEIIKALDTETVASFTRI